MAARAPARRSPSSARAMRSMRRCARAPGPARATTPGKRANLATAGHRDGYFRGLRHIEEGDEFSLTTPDGVAHYRVEKISIVHPKRTDVLASTGDPTLTLVTCSPF